MGISVARHDAPVEPESAAVIEREMVEALCSSPPDFLKMVALVQFSSPFVLRVREPTAQRSPLHIAAMHNKVTYAAMLLSRGADIEARDVWLWTPLMSAVFGEANGAGPDTAHLLLSLGAEVNAKCIRGTTSLHVCAAYGSIELMDAVVRRGADCSALDGTLETPLHKAALRGSIDAVRYLVDHGANSELRSAKGETASDLAAAEASQEHLEVVDFLSACRK